MTTFSCISVLLNFLYLDCAFVFFRFSFYLSLYFYTVAQHWDKQVICTKENKLLDNFHDSSYCCCRVCQYQNLCVFWVWVSVRKSVCVVVCISIAVNVCHMKNFHGIVQIKLTGSEQKSILALSKWKMGIDRASESKRKENPVRPNAMARVAQYTQPIHTLTQTHTFQSQHTGIIR